MSDIGVVGFAGGCAFDEDHRNIPIIGFMNLYADSWQQVSDDAKFQILSHEITHVLAFLMEPHYYDNWIDVTGRPYDKDTMFREVTRNGVEHKYLATPRVKQVAA